MTTIMTRKGAAFWWNLNKENKIVIPPEIAYYEKLYPHEEWRPVTYAEINKDRKKQQDGNIERKRRHEVIKPCFLWVFYNPHFPYSGWWISVKTLHDIYMLNFRQNRTDLIQKAMEMFPCGVLPMIDNFEHWAHEFSIRYHRSTRGKRKKSGMTRCSCTIDEYGNLIDIERLGK